MGRAHRGAAGRRLPDTIVDGVNGVFVEEPTVDAVAAGVERMLAADWDRDAMRGHADRFSEEAFARQIRALVAELPGADMS